MDTIFALSTPPGKSGVAIVRVSGPAAADTLRAFGIASLPSPRVAMLRALRVPSSSTPCHSREGGNLGQDPRLRGGDKKNSVIGEIIDHALILYFPAPRSFTGEDSVEFHLHGSRAVIQAVLAVLGALPSLRPAEPGEFTRRAFLSGKMDLTAAEGLADLIDAETEAQRRQAVRFLRGEGAAFYQGLREEVVDALALTEAYIDFPDEEIPEQAVAEAQSRMRALAQRIESELAASGAAERVRDGVRVAIVGPPNAGKSSLLNLLARRDVAIVSETAGTTRDVIEVHLDIAGFAVILADTAGLREAQDDIEREGVRRSLKRAREADLCLAVLDATEAEAQWDALRPRLPSSLPHIVLLNKTDLLSSPALSLIENRHSRAGGNLGQDPRLRGGDKNVLGDINPNLIPFSAKTGTGLDALMQALAAHVARLSSAESCFIFRARHHHHLEQALTHLRNYLSRPATGLELTCEELRRAAVEIGKITGAVSPEEVLGRIFSRFCIGK